MKVFLRDLLPRGLGAGSLLNGMQVSFNATFIREFTPKQ